MYRPLSGARESAYSLQNLLLLRQNHELKNAAQPPTIHLGQRLEGLAGVNAAAALARVKLPSAKTDKLLIIAFSPLCPYSRQNTPGWLRLTYALKARRSWDVVWVSRNLEDVTRQFSEEQHLPIENVVWDPSHRTYLQLGLETVPSVIAVDGTGTVQKVWIGTLRSAAWKEIADYTGVPYGAIADDGTMGTQSMR